MPLRRLVRTSPPQGFTKGVEHQQGATWCLLLICCMRYSHKGSKKPFPRGGFGCVSSDQKRMALGKQIDRKIPLQPLRGSFHPGPVRRTQHRTATHKQHGNPKPQRIRLFSQIVGMTSFIILKKLVCDLVSVILSNSSPMGLWSCRQEHNPRMGLELRWQKMHLQRCTN